MPLYTQPHLTQSVVMVEPVDFGYNEQTGIDNEFQNKPSVPEISNITASAQREFSLMVEQLQSHKIEVLVLGKTHTSELVPDAIFPNNWFSTRNSGEIFIYPMKTPNRQAEVQIDGLSNKLIEAGYLVDNIHDLRQSFDGNILEGTGSLVFHHPSSKAFASISERCERTALESFCQQNGYQCIPMVSCSQSGNPIYHTNVLMSCGENFAVIAESVLTNNPENKKAYNALKEAVDDVIIISEAQMTNSFCGNILQVKNTDNQPCIIMSKSAFDGFTQPQLSLLEKHGQIIPCAIPTIEKIGGGSARCMLAENFLPKKPHSKSF